MSNPEEALGAETHILYEQGQWILYLDMFFAQEMRRFQINSYRTERLAQVAANQVLRYTLRDLPPHSSQKSV